MGNMDKRHGVRIEDKVTGKLIHFIETGYGKPQRQTLQKVLKDINPHYIAKIGCGD